MRISLTPGSSAPPSMSPESTRLMPLEASRLQLSLIDSKDNQQQLSDAARVLAYKIWYALSEGARVEFQPDSWKTVYYFVHALRALRRNQLDPTESTAAEEALTCLRMLGDLDPLYRPGHFFLGFAYLTSGNAHEAQREFERLMQPVEKAADALLRLMEQEWHRQVRVSALGLLIRFRKQLPTWGRRDEWLALRIPAVEEWSDLWEDVLVNLHGGVWYFLAAAWREFPERFEKWKSMAEDDELSKLSFEIYMESVNIKFKPYPAVSQLAKVAAGRSTHQRQDGLEISSQEARKKLNDVLDFESVEQLNHKLRLLDIKLDSMRERDSAEQRLEQLLEIESLKESTVLFREEFERLYERWQAEDWEACRRILRDIYHETQGPDKEAARRLVASVELPYRHSWLVKRVWSFLPAVQRWRNTFVKDRLYLESRYYLNLAKFQTFTSDKLQEAMEDARDLHVKLLPAAEPSSHEQMRRDELRRLCLCLEVDAGVRILLSSGEGGDVAREIEIWRRLNKLIEEEGAKLKAFRVDESRAVAAAAYCTLGLLQRYQRDSTSWHLKSTPHIEEDEIECFEKSLKLRSTANT
jgi:hypothetical protein